MLFWPGLPAGPGSGLWEGGSSQEEGCTAEPSLSRLFSPAVHAAVIAINEAVDRQIPAETFSAMQNPNAVLVNLDETLALVYQGTLFQAKQEKAENTRKRVKFSQGWDCCGFGLLIFEGLSHQSPRGSSGALHCILGGLEALSISEFLNGAGLPLGGPGGCRKGARCV